MDHLPQFPFKRFYELCIVVSLLYISAWGYSHLERIDSLIERREKWAQVHSDFRIVDLILIDRKIGELENQLGKTNYAKKSNEPIRMRGDNIASISYYYSPNSNTSNPLMDSLNNLSATRARIEVEIYLNRGLTDEINKRYLIVDIIGFGLLVVAIGGLFYGLWTFKNKAKT